jgi:ribosomal protein S15P/S13E
MDKNETGEHMGEKKSGIFKLVEGLKPVDASALAEYEREMTEAIPEIIKDVEKRRMLAAESRQRRLAMPTSDKPEPRK